MPSAGPPRQGARHYPKNVRGPISVARVRISCVALVGLGTPAHSEVVHNEEDQMGRTLQLGDARVDEAALAELCRRYHVRELSMFGSAARGNMRQDSDIDLLVEFLPEAEVDLVDHAGLMLDLADLLGREVDLVSKNGLKPLIRASVLEEARLL